MKRAGCVGIDFGVDSGDDDMLHRLGRDFTAEDLREVAHICHDEGIIFMYDLLIGGPGETPESARRTIELMRELDPSRVGVALGVRIYPRTALARMVRLEGMGPDNPHLHGSVGGNAHLLAPIFYLPADLGPDVVGDLVGDDERFFFGGGDSEETDYNYSENELLVEAIQKGYRGAFWDILRRLQEEDGV